MPKVGEEMIRYLGNDPENGPACLHVWNGKSWEEPVPVQHIKRLLVMAVQFKREEHSEPENGIIINEGDGPIIDMDGKEVPAPVWNYDCNPYKGCMVLEDEA